jgi:thiol:disulfide interchange protein DsbD
MTSVTPRSRHAFDPTRVLGTVAALICLPVTACGGSEPPPVHANQAKKEPDAAARAARQKASRLAKLEDDSTAAERMPESVVQVTFEPLVTGVRPGRKFLLAAHFRIAKGYRISWKNPGDVGKETVVDFRAPEGFEVGPAAFPVPDRYTVPGGFTGYGYQGETAVFVEVKAPPNLSRSGVHRFDLSASWVACKKECATEHTDAFVELATTYGNVAAKEAEDGLAPFKARLPKPLSDVKDADQKWERSGRGATLVVSIPGAEPRDFMPGEKAEPAPKKVSMSNGEVRFAFGETPGPASKPLRGIIVAASEGADAFIDLEAASPDGERAEHAPAEPKHPHAHPKGATTGAHKTPSKKRH